MKINESKNYGGSTHIFKNPLYFVWPVIKDSNGGTNLNANGYQFPTLNQIQRSTGSYYEIGTKLKIGFENKTSLTYHILDMFETDYYCHIKWECFLSVYIPPIICYFHLHYELYDHTTILLIEYVFPNILNNWFNNDELSRQSYYSQIDKFISDKEFLKHIYISAEIKGDFAGACGVLSKKNVLLSCFSSSNNSSCKSMNDNEIIIKEVDKNFEVDGVYIKLKGVRVKEKGNKFSKYFEIGGSDANYCSRSSKRIAQSTIVIEVAKGVGRNTVINFICNFEEVTGRKEYDFCKRFLERCLKQIKEGIEKVQENLSKKGKSSLLKPK